MSVVDLPVELGHGVFARFFAPPGRSSPLNLFKRADLSRVEGDVSAIVAMMDQLIRDGFLVETSSGDLLVPIRGRLVLPSAGSAAPLVLFLHGNAPALFDRRTGRRKAETLSSDGYRRLQHHLAEEREIASFSINLNIVNTFDSYEDPLLRAQFALLSFMLLRRLASPYTVAASEEPLYMRPGTGDPMRLAEALDRSPPFPTGSTLQRLHALKSTLTGRLDFTRVGLLGHSRGANAVLDYTHFLPPSASASLSRGPTAINPHLLTAMTRLGRQLDGHRSSDVGGIVSLQPTPEPQTMVSDTTFCLVVASSHDEDTQEQATQVYDGLDCPRAMLFVHGATHNRFSEVWRRLPSKVDLMRRNIDCQRPIRILSNRGHDDIAAHFFGGFFAGRLAGQAYELGLLSAQHRAPIRVDVERSWLFGFPLVPGAVRLLDSRVTSATNLVSSSSVQLSKTELSTGYTPSHFAQTVPVFRIEKPSGVTFRIEVPVTDADDLEHVTHVGFRHAKEYDVSNPRSRAAELLLNFAIELMAGPLRIGRVIPGSTFRSLVQRAYPTRQWSGEVGQSGGCYEDTKIVLQTVEAAMSQFLAGTRHTSSDLARVDRIIIDLLPATGQPGNDIHVLTDLVLTKRSLPSAP